MDLFVAPTASFKVLYGLLIIRQGGRRPLWLGVTAHPAADWIIASTASATRRWPGGKGSCAAAICAAARPPRPRSIRARRSEGKAFVELIA